MNTKSVWLIESRAGHIVPRVTADSEAQAKSKFARLRGVTWGMLDRLGYRARLNRRPLGMKP